MRNWQTTAAAVATAGFGFILFSPQYFPLWMVDMSKYAMLGGLAALGIVAKDFNSHSTAAEVEIATARKVVDQAEKAENKV